LLGVRDDGSVSGEKLTSDLKAPRFKTNGFFRAILYRPKAKAAAIGREPGVQKGVQKSAQKGAQKTSERILELIERNPSITMAELAEQLHKSQSAIKKNLRILKSEGVIRRVGPDKGGHWQKL